MLPTFDSLALSPSLLAVVAELGYDSLTPIQAESIPVFLSGRDLIGQSQTGSGKTAAFALPILNKLALDQRALQALVLCPTRELCAQVTRELRKLGRKEAGLQVLAVSGGEPARAQTEALARGVHMVVGTPGRVLDHVKRGSIEFSGVTTVVLDEADRMLDMGFEDEMREILRALPKSRQTALYSATFPDAIAAISRSYQQDAVRVTIDALGEDRVEIRELTVRTQASEKMHALYWVLANHTHESALIFCNTKATISELTRGLCASGLSANCLHGDLEQFERDRVMAMFRNGSVRLLIASDVAARGIDVAGLDLVVNYDLPQKPDTYIHRIGRTGRAGKSGLAISLATVADERALANIEQRPGARLELVRCPSGGPQEIELLARRLAGLASMETIHILGGRKDKLRPGDILGALTGEAGGLQADEIGKIEIHDRLSYVAVSRRRSRQALESLNKGRIKGKRFRASVVRGFAG